VQPSPRAQAQEHQRRVGDRDGGQVLLAYYDFLHREQHNQAQETLRELFKLGVVPIVNENDAVSDDEIRYGDNDRMAALVANMVGADVLVLLTDTPGLLSAHPLRGKPGSLIEEIDEVDHEYERMAGGPGSARSAGGMASKLRAAKMAAWSGVRVVIAAAARPDVLVGAVDGKPGIGTVVRPRDRRLSAWKLWIAFALEAMGTIIVDDGARRALLEQNRSLLPAGILEVEGRFDAEEAVEIRDRERQLVGKGLVSVSSDDLRPVVGRRTSDLPEGMPHEVVHRDNLVTGLP
jgi:glutamate 5-kinase